MKFLKTIVTRVRSATSQAKERVAGPWARAKAWWTEPRRAYLYRTLGGLSPLAVAYGELADQRSASIAGFVGVLGSTIVAIFNTSTE